MVGVDPRPAARKSFRAVAVPAGPPFNWLTTSPYPLSRCHLLVEGSNDSDMLSGQIGSHHATNKLAEDFSHQEAVTRKYLH